MAVGSAKTSTLGIREREKSARSSVGTRATTSISASLPDCCASRIAVSNSSAIIR
jgi:hypothetical protein